MRRVRYIRIAGLLAALALIVQPGSIRAQPFSKRFPQTTGPNIGQQVFYLVARRELSDPFFKESVVLMLPQKDQDLIVGLIVNKPTHISLHAVFPENSALKNRSDTVYFGGPVGTQTPGALFRSSKPFKQAFNVAGDLYVTFDSHFIEGILKNPKKVLDMRVFLGRSQWSPEQLQNEMLRRSWYNEREANSWVFSRYPENVWRAFIERIDPQNTVVPTAWSPIVVPEIRRPSGFRAG
jgi:putative transcriptional regulator